MLDSSGAATTGYGGEGHRSGGGRDDDARAGVVKGSTCSGGAHFTAALGTIVEAKLLEMVQVGLVVVVVVVVVAAAAAVAVMVVVVVVVV